MVSGAVGSALIYLSALIEGTTVLRVNDIWAKGRHRALFGRTTFEVGEGETIIVQADSQMERTALALALTGRLPLSGGTIEWGTGGDKPRPISLKKLRRLSEVVDSPEITAPEQHMRVHDYVSEMLSYNLPIFGRPRASRWLEERGLKSLDSMWMDELDGEMNIELMAALAHASPSNLLVFDTPSRHLNHTRMWLPFLQELATNEDRPRTVVAIVPHISSTWHGARAVVGNAHDAELLSETPEKIRYEESESEEVAGLDILQVGEKEGKEGKLSTSSSPLVAGTMSAVDITPSTESGSSPEVPLPNLSAPAKGKE